MPNKKPTKENNNNKIAIYDLSSNIFTSFKRAFLLSAKNIWRNKILSSATIIVLAIMVCIFNSILAINFISKDALNKLNQKVDIVLYFKAGTDFYNANLLASELRELPGVKQVEYISEDQALDIISKTYPETADFLTKFDLQNPLPASLSIITETAENHQAIYDFLKASPQKEYLEINFTDNEINDQEIISSTTTNLLSINNFVRQLIFWIVFIFLIGGALITINAIQLTIFTRRNEIFIMRLVGASPSFIRLPFILESIFYAISAVLLGFLLLYLAGNGTNFSDFQFSNQMGDLNITQLILLEILICSILAVISTITTVETYLRKKLSFN